LQWKYIMYERANQHFWFDTYKYYLAQENKYGKIHQWYTKKTYREIIWTVLYSVINKCYTFIKIFVYTVGLPT